MKRLSICDNWQKHPKKIKLNESLTLLSIASNSFHSTIFSIFSEEYVEFKFSFENFLYSFSYISQFMIDWIKDISKIKTIIFYPSFTNWLENINVRELPSEDIKIYIKLLKTLMDSKIMDIYYHNINPDFIRIYCKLYHAIDDSQIKKFIGFDIYYYLNQTDYGLISHEKDFMEIFYSLFLMDNLENQILALNYWILTFKNFKQLEPIDKAILNKLTTINSKLKNDNVSNFSQIETKLVIKSVFFSEILLESQEFRSQETPWIDNNFSFFFQYKQFCNKNWITKNVKYNIKAISSTFINCLTFCFKTMSKSEIFNQYPKFLDEFLTLKTYITLEFGINSPLRVDLVKIAENSFLLILKHIAYDISRYDIQSWFLSNFNHLVLNLGRLKVLSHVNKDKLDYCTIKEIYNIFLSALVTDLDIVDHIELSLIILNIFISDFYMKLDNRARVNDIDDLISYLTELRFGIATINKYGLWIQAFQIEPNFNFKLPNTFNDEYTLNYLSIICCIWSKMMDKIIVKLSNENLDLKKYAIGSICLILESSNLIVSFMTGNQLIQISNSFFSLIQEREGSEIMDFKLAIKSYLEVFDHIFSSSFCYYKHENLFNEIAPKLIYIIGEELKTNKMRLQNYFIKETNLVNCLLSLVIKFKEYPINLIKSYFENVRIFIKSSLKNWNDDQKSTVKNMVISNLRNSAKNILVSQIDTCYFLFSLKYWTFESFCIPSTEIFLREIFSKVDENTLLNYGLTTFIGLFYNFFISMLKYWSGIRTCHELFENTVDVFVDYIRNYFGLAQIQNIIMKINLFDDRNYFEFWILFLILKKTESEILKDIYVKLFEILREVDSKKRISLVTYQLFYLSFEVLASKKDFCNKPIDIKNVNIYLIVRNCQFYKEKFINYYENRYKLHNCEIDKSNFNLNQTLIIKLPSKFKMTFKANFVLMAENSHYFEASLRFSKIDIMSIDLSNDSTFYCPFKEEAVKLALKLSNHLLHGSTLVNCRLISCIKDKKLLNSSLWMCLFIVDRLQMKSKPKTYLFDFIFSNIFVKFDSQCIPNEICNAINYVVKSGCLYFYNIILEVVINHLKYFNSSKISRQCNKKMIMTIIKTTFAHHEFFGSDLCAQRLKKFIWV